MKLDVNDKIYGDDEDSETMMSSWLAQYFFPFIHMFHLIIFEQISCVNAR